ncbi:MAG: Tex-like N-terminal domain-containing protein, partial [Thermodesulfobacteriota bacterium]|nr:Tex-like N-terminal domain-containing protein [Thermodesulfobacteriota bacterium]
METDTFTSKIAQEQNLNSHQVASVRTLLAEGATIPFIARYRKEATGSLDEVAVRAIRDRLNQLKDLTDRQMSILKSLEKHGHLTDELKEKVIGTETLATLEDIYLPYRPKRRTRAVMAREKGLEPLALLILEQKGIDPNQAAASFIDPEKKVDSAEDALAGARDIIAEIVNERDEVRARVRNLFFNKALVKSRVLTRMEDAGAKFRDYFDWEEPV